MRLALAPKVAVAVAEEDRGVVEEEDMGVAEEDEGVAGVSNHRHSADLSIII